ncbi:transcriptional regulator with XRE-family HTH domain [Oxalobacteraceae bacterium GrIS 1.11]
MTTSRTTDYRVDLGARILAARLRADLTQDDLAACVGMSQQCVAKWESGKSAPRAGRMDALVSVLGPLNGEASKPLIAALPPATSNTAAPSVLRELLMAELIIITMLNAMTPKQKLLVHDQLDAAGLSGEGMTRHHERRAAITAAGAA